MKKIVLFLSAPSREPKERVYMTPEGEEILGVETNDAPIRWLLRTNPIDEILCIATPQTKGSTWEHFNQIVESESKAKVIEIPFDPKIESFAQGPLENILNRIDDSDEIFLETTGGMRDSVFSLILMSRILSYRQIPLIKAVYSDFGKQRLRDVTGDYQMFELINGLNEFTSFGNVTTLLRYGQGKPELLELCTTMKDLNESLILCQTDSLPGKLQRFNQAMKKAEQNATGLMKNLLPVFRKKFGNGNLTILDMIRWCTENQMLQQALTLYTERIPAYLLRESGVLQVSPKAEPTQKPQAHENPDAVLFLHGFLKLAVGACGNQVERLRAYIQANLEDLKFARGLGDMNKQPDGDIRIAVENILELRQCCYNHDCSDKHRCGSYRKKSNSACIGCRNSNWREDLSRYKKGLLAMEEVIEDTAMPDRMIHKLAVATAAQLNCLLERTDMQAITIPKGDMTIGTLENLDALLPGSLYDSHVPTSVLKQISMDYLHIKILRNHINHAAEDKGGNAKSDYLQAKGYDCKNHSADYIQQTLLNAITRIEQAQKQAEKS